MARDTRTGTEILFEEDIRRIIHGTPSQELRENLYGILAGVVVSTRNSAMDTMDVGELAERSMEKFTAYSILEKAGYVTTKNYRGIGTRKGVKVQASLES